MKLQVNSKKAGRHEGPITIDSPVELVTEGIDSDPAKPARLGMWILILGFGGFLAWALLAPLDTGVPAPGTVSVESQRKTIQHLSGGIVEKIQVKEGDEVKAGQVLLILNSTTARANVGITRAQYFAARGMENRLMAEYQNQSSIKFDPDLLQAKSDPRVAEVIEVQSRLFATRRNSWQREAEVLKESAAALEPQLKGMRELAKEGYIPRNKMLDTERSYAEIRLRILQQQQEYRKQVETQLTEAQREASSQHDRLKAAEEELARTEIKAPVDGYVVGLGVSTVGGVIPPGGRLLDIVPRGEPFVIEAQIPTHMIDQVHVGMEADLRFSAFEQNKTPIILGKVATLSADRLTDPATRQPYYLVRVTVPPEEMTKLGGHRVQPGMPVEVILKSGSRTLMNYLLKPLFDRFANSLKER